MKPRQRIELSVIPVRSHIRIRNLYLIHSILAACLREVPPCGAEAENRSRSEGERC